MTTQASANGTRPKGKSKPPKAVKANKDPEGRMPLGDHIRELRTRLFRASVGIALGAIAGWLVHAWVIQLLENTVCNDSSIRGVGQATKQCKNGIVTLSGATAGISISLKVSLLVGLLLASPVWLYQLWAFIAPGLHKNEKKYSLSFVAAGVPLFAAGTALCYLIFPTIMRVLLGFTPKGVSNLLPLDTFINFFMRMVLIFGVSFEVPLIVVALNFTGVLSAARLKKSWRYVTFGIFIFAATAVPTGEPLGMTALAAPMCLLYYGAIGIAVMNDKRRAARNINANLSPDEASDVDLAPLPVEQARPVEQVRRGFDDDYDDLT
ncbi:twin-arginine translocase subunit TatC [Catenulispora sp. NF23]|uniref:Sec-independent protein translocase protein TatC n=1 Tax=Catenulispora pinistramenti TaxID=2705254 RepID=A0ABS5KUX1_9ACTN|nr:twin-arginine translocase subunit TatC [Catenulispora pinistramenti]MBS2538132.1 twin-arginine translocase subunit TatC [Catenulispora pinistramenti]MBS2549853.1 twin-arginine translocase subunit TatC [Catenulispora pinistramenti]